MSNKKRDIRIKEKLLLLSLGRTITPFDIAKRVIGRTPTPSEMGVWYTYKDELKKEGLIVELPQEGRTKPIRANIQRYFDIALKNIWEKVEKDSYEQFLQENVPLFEKYAARIVDFILEETDYKKGKYKDSILVPIAFFLAVRASLLHSNLPTHLYKVVKDLMAYAAPFFNYIFAFNSKLSEDEKRELQPTENVMKFYIVMLNLLEPELVKNAYIAFFKSLTDNSLLS